MKRQIGIFSFLWAFQAHKKEKNHPKREYEIYKWLLHRPFERRNEKKKKIGPLSSGAS